MNRRAMTLIEVMVALAILSFAVMAMVGNIFALNNAHKAAKETAIAQQIVQTVIERFQGASWFSLGTLAQPWSWHRRDRTGATYPPMTENNADPNSDLRAQGIVTGPSGLLGAKLYVEYYRMSLFSDGTGTWSVSSPASYRARIADSTYWLPEACLPAVPTAGTFLDLTQQQDAIVVRLLLTWTDQMGANRRHEVVFARRR